MTSTRRLLLALSQRATAEVTDLGVWPDDRDEVIKRLQQAAGEYDLLVTSGGASQGEEDHISHALAAIGARHFWQIAVKPGRPLMLGQIGDTAVVGLPGNPVAVFVCFLDVCVAADTAARWCAVARTTPISFAR